MILKITIFSINNQFNDLVKAALLEKEELMEQRDFNLEMTDESAKSQDFFQNNKAFERKYITNRTKSRKFLSKIGYVCINKEDFDNENFLFLTFIYY